ncbi:M4 family metallopeptidase [Tumebacillus permanentifrigoris]|uniref:Neutral metalloproteinase n=1 Tax=Tumebacillus permanentifrigoris TaxID=378543 RepID=A0A316DF65_9BACL|nr:M4 family metallopeptidase [Tumebacillus permanentifrigoris]PWK16366.1 thermolysin [Tumebacillus permanentifrigoris]
MNKKLVTTLVMSSLVASAFAMSAGAAPADKQVLKSETGSVHNVVGTIGKVTGATAEARALNALEKVKTDFGFDKAAGSFKAKESHADENGLAHTKMINIINGIEVFGQQMIVHEKSGDVSGVTGSFKKLTPTAKSATIDSVTAVSNAIAATGAAGEFTEIPNATLMYYPVGDQAVLTYKVSYSALGDTPARADVFVNATDGSIVKVIDKIEHVVGTGTGVLGDTKSINTTLRSGAYYLEDTTKPMTGIVRTRDMKNRASLIYDMTDTDNVWNTTYQRAGVDAQFYAGQVYDWYKNNVGRNSIDNNGMSLESLVHYNKNYNNAFWNGTYMVYGDGDGVTFRAFSGAIDVIGHELTHGVTEKTSGLIYQDQSGALNESWSDAMGAVIEGRNWLMGEDLCIPGGGYTAFRSMEDPTIYGDPANMSQYVVTTSDNGGVHTNSGIPNKAFYNFATAIGSRTIAGKVWYTADRDYMVSNTNFSGARAATLSAVGALYGTTSSYYTALQAAWSNVGVN